MVGVVVAAPVQSDHSLLRLCLNASHCPPPFLVCKGVGKVPMVLNWG